MPIGHVASVLLVTWVGHPDDPSKCLRLCDECEQLALASRPVLSIFPLVPFAQARRLAVQIDCALWILGEPLVPDDPFTYAALIPDNDLDLRLA